jgi:hypothetical protein
VAAPGLCLERDGAEYRAGAATDVLGALDTALNPFSRDQAGARLFGVPGLATLLAMGSPIGDAAAARLGPAATPVRAILFDKTPGANWALGWHQDRTVAVAHRFERPGWGPWSIKRGVQHVEPPFTVIERMLTVRVHLDPVPADNAPLLIAPGSHRLGRLREGEIDAAVRRCGVIACLAERGDVWVYATAIVHASAASTGYAHRRVLQVDYAAEALEPPLRWLGV